MDLLSVCSYQLKAEVWFHIAFSERDFEAFMESF